MVTVPIGRTEFPLNNVWEIRVRVRFGVRFRVMVRFRVRVSVRVSVRVNYLGTLSRYYCAHSITPRFNRSVGTITTAYLLVNKLHIS